MAQFEVAPSGSGIYRVYARSQEWFVGMASGVVFGPFASQLQADVEAGLIVSQWHAANEPLSKQAAYAFAAASNTGCHFPEIKRVGS
jgi:hypothetical protein